MKNIDPKLRKLRLINDKKQEELASLLNIKQQQYSKLERGETKHIKLHHIHTISKFYNIQVGHFFEDE